MRELKLSVLFIFVSTIIQAQTLEEKVAVKFCECFTRIDKTQKAETILTYFQDTCILESMMPFEADVVALIPTAPGATQREKAQYLGKKVAEDAFSLMVDRCDPFYDYMRLIRQNIFTTKDAGNVKLKIDSLTQKIKATNQHKDYIKRSRQYLALNQIKPALKDLDKAIDLNQNDLEAHILRASVFEETKKYKKALSAYEACRKIQDRPDITMYIAIVKRKMREQ